MVFVYFLRVFFFVFQTKWTFGEWNPRWCMQMANCRSNLCVFYLPHWMLIFLVFLHIKHKSNKKISFVIRTFWVFFFRFKCLWTVNVDRKKRSNEQKNSMYLLLTCKMSRKKNEQLHETMNFIKRTLSLRRPLVTIKMKCRSVEPINSWIEIAGGFCCPSWFVETFTCFLIHSNCPCWLFIVTFYY